MFESDTTRRILRWISMARSSKPAAQRSEIGRRPGSSRPLRMEQLEERSLLSVTGIGGETFKTVPFAAFGNVVSDYSDSGYQFHLIGTANLGKGAIQYDSVDDGILADSGAAHGAILTVNNGTYTAKGRPNFSGTWRLKGYSDNIVDQSGQLTGSVIVQSSSMQIPTRPTVVDSFKGDYEMSNARLNTKGFGLVMDLVKPDGTKLNFKGNLNPVGSPFDVLVTPTWNADGTIHVGVRVPGKPHTTATADRSAPVTNVQVYWAQGSTLKSAALDSIPVYWNEAGGSYTVAIADYPTAPAGATNLAFVTRFDGKTRIAKLPLPTVSIAAANVAEGDSSDPAARNQAAIPVTLSRASTKDVTVSYTTYKDARDTAKPGVDYVATRGSIVIPAGQTQGQIDVPIVGNTKHELNKVFSVKLTQVQNAGINAKRALAKGIIANDDPIPAISIADVTADEGNRGTTRLNFAVTLSNASYQTVQVRYKIAPGTAAAGADYLARPPATLTFRPGVTTQIISVFVKGDAAVEQDETFFINLFAPRFATLADSQGVGTIASDDVLPAQTASGARDVALTQLTGFGSLSDSFDPLGRKKGASQE